jgi:hypothetical protein
MRDPIPEAVESIRRHFWPALSACLAVILIAFSRDDLKRASVSPRCKPDSYLTSATGFPLGNDQRVVDVGCVDESGKRDGVALRLVEGAPSSLSHFNHGVLDGNTVIWGPTGNVEMITHVSGGRPAGISLVLDSEGRPKSMVEIDPGSGRASQYSWYPNGGQRLIYQTTVDTESGLPTANLVGEYRIRDAEGAVLARGRYDNGARIGEWQCRQTGSDAFMTASFPADANQGALVECLHKVSEHSSPTRKPSQVATTSPHS